MKIIIAYGLIAFAIGGGISGIAGRIFNIPWLFGQFNAGDPGMAASTAIAIVSLGIGVFLLHSAWRDKKNQTNEKEIE